VSAVTAVKIPTAEISVQQPDKKLPVPAHQLKKVIASTPANSEDDLQAKIAAANQSIEALDKELSKQLPKNPDSPEPSSTTDADDNQDIKHRLENIKNHLQKTQ
jgi:hypothetical protein